MRDCCSTVTLLFVLKIQTYCLIKIIWILLLHSLRCTLLQIMILCVIHFSVSQVMELWAIKMSAFLEYNRTSLTVSYGTQCVKTRLSKIQRCFLPEIIAQLLKRNHRYYCELWHRNYFSIEGNTHQLWKTGLYFQQNMNSNGTPPLSCKVSYPC